MPHLSLYKHFVIKIHIGNKVRRLHHAMMGFAVAALLVSCGNTKSTNTTPALVQSYCKYSAVSRDSASKPAQAVFVFPPLRCNAKGKPIETLKPSMKPNGEIEDWLCPSPVSALLQRQIAEVMKAKGYQVAKFADVLNMKEPHSILMISALYSMPSPVKPKAPKDPDTVVLTMIKVKTFDLDLNPGTSLGVSDIDGMTMFHQSKDHRQVLGESFGVLLGWLGDNVSGIQYLD